MRAVTVHVGTDQGYFGPFHRGVVETPAVSLRALHELRMLADGSAVMLYEYAGDAAAAVAVAEARLDPDGGTWQTGRVDGTEWMFAHAEPSGRVRNLLVLLGEFSVAVDWPIPFPSDETAAVTLVGDDDELGRALAAVPDEVSVRLERSGEYRSESERLAAGLTDRERHTLAAAVELGYYRNPREANYADVAAELDCSTGTVGTHLRNAESKVMRELVAERFDAPGPRDHGALPGES